MDNPLKLIDPDGMDWIEDKDGKVSWYRHITKDNVPHGYKYIGTSYMGIEINTYNAYTDESGAKNLEVRIGYSNPKSKEKSYNWVQTVERNNSGKPFVDYDKNSKEGRANYPYYQDKSENIESRSQGGHDITYYDCPNVIKSDGSFSAELSLIGDPVGIRQGNKIWNPNTGVIGKNVYTPEVTLQYGFAVKNGVMTVAPVKVIEPSSYQVNVINQIP